MRNFLAAALVPCAVFALSCGSSSSNGGGNNFTVDPGAWQYTESQFVVDEITIPLTSTEAKEYAFDLDGNGTKDNQLGNILAALKDQMGETNPQTAISDAMALGNIVLLLSVYAESVQESPKANLWAFVGLPPDPPLTNGPQPGMTFEVDEERPMTAYLGGRIKGGGGLFGSSTANLTLNLPLAEGSDLSLSLLSAHVEFDVSADGLALEEGHLGGAISETELNTKVLPEVQTLLDAQLIETCAARQDGGTALDGGTGTCGCVANTGGATAQSMFDTNLDCTISLDEVTENQLLKAFLKGDVTLPDGTKALSLAVKFHAVNAVFSHVAPPS